MKCKATSIGLCEMYPNFEFPTEAVLKRLAVRSRVRGLRFSNTRANSMRQLRKSRLVAIFTEEVLLSFHGDFAEQAVLLDFFSFEPPECNLSEKGMRCI